MAAVARVKVVTDLAPTTYWLIEKTNTGVLLHLNGRPKHFDCMVSALDWLWAANCQPSEALSGRGWRRTVVEPRHWLLMPGL